MVDMTNGGPCQYDPNTNMPTETCWFIPNPNLNDNMETSIMAVPFFPQTDHFCEDPLTSITRDHQPEMPNKHNAMCNYLSTWDVVAPNDDFIESTPCDEPDCLTLAPQTTFTIMRPMKAQYVLALEASKVMKNNNAFERMKRSTSRWLKYDVADGAQVGIVRIGDYPMVVANMTTVDPSSRELLIDLVNGMSAQGGACLEDGLLLGLDVLRQTSAKGGVEIFFTSGSDSTCDSGLNVVEAVSASGTRVVTISFGTGSSDELEKLAEISGGETYFIGGAFANINDALQGTLNYGPKSPSGESDYEVIKPLR